MHNLYLFYDQYTIFDEEAIHEKLDPIHEMEIQLQPIHNLYLFYDQDIPYEEDVLEQLDPIPVCEKETSITPIHLRSSAINDPTTSTSSDETLASQVHMNDQPNNLDPKEHNDDQDSSDPSPSIIDQATNPSSSI